MENTQKDYKKLQEISRHAKTLAGVASLLEWDHETYMPPGASEIRGEQLKALAGLIHKEKTSKKFSKALGKLIHLKTGKPAGKGLKDEQKAALREWRRDFCRDT